MEILKTGMLHKEVCVQSLWETVECRDKGKNKRMLHKDAFLRMCGLCVCKTFCCFQHPYTSALRSELALLVYFVNFHLQNISTCMVVVIRIICCTVFFNFFICCTLV